MKLKSLHFILFFLTTFYSWAGITETRLIIQEIQLHGNKRTKDFMIFREMDFSVGDTLTNATLVARLERNRQNIFNTNLFVTVAVRHENIDKEHIIIHFDLREQWYIFPFPVFQLADKNFNVWWYQQNHDLNRTIYGINWRFRNLRGRGEELKLNFETGFARFIEASYRFPYIDAVRKTGLTLGISYSTARNIAYRNNADTLWFFRGRHLPLGITDLRNRFVVSALFRRRNKLYDYHFLEARYSNTQIADTVAFRNPDYFLNGRTQQRYFSLQYSYVYSFLDRNQYPLRGKNFSAAVSRLGLFPTDDVQQFDIYVHLENYIPLSKRLFYALNTELKATLPNQKQSYPLIRGMGSQYPQDFVRGFDLFNVDGQHYIYARNTLRWRAFEQTFNLKFLKINQFNAIPLAVYPYLFLDAGYVSSNFALQTNSKLANKLMIGSGIGLDFVTFYNIVIRIYRPFNAEAQGRLYFYREF